MGGGRAPPEMAVSQRHQARPMKAEELGMPGKTSQRPGWGGGGGATCNGNLKMTAPDNSLLPATVGRAADAVGAPQTGIVHHHTGTRMEPFLEAQKEECSRGRWMSIAARGRSALLMAVKCRWMCTFEHVWMLAERLCSLHGQWVQLNGWPSAAAAQLLWWIWQGKEPPDT